MRITWLYELPLWLDLLLLLILFLGVVEVGFRSGLRSSRLQEAVGEASRKDITLSAMLALLGLLLAFTYAFALGRADLRKAAVIEEANAISIAFHRADLLPEPGRTDLRRLLLDYARTRVITRNVNSRARLRKVVLSSLEAQDRIWPALVRGLTDDVPAQIKALNVIAVNNVLAVHKRRLAAGLDTVPPAVLILLTVVAALALLMAAHNAGLQGNVFRWRMRAFAVVLAALIVLIMDFDLIHTGLVRVSYDGLITLIPKMEAALSG